MKYFSTGFVLPLVIALQACSSGSGSPESDDVGNGTRTVSISANNLNGRLILEIAGQRVELDSGMDANQAVEVRTEGLVTAKVIEQPGIQSCVFGNEVGKTTLAEVGPEVVLNCDDLIFFAARDNDEFRYGLW